MGRWEPGAKHRLQAAAMELYLRRGFEQTTVTEIAESVGLTEHTFFRHFADKREVLFAGQEAFEQAFLDGLDDVPAEAPALELVDRVLRSAAAMFPDERREYARRRQSVIAANPALQEREQLKLTGLGTVLAASLRDRGLSEPAATIAAQSAVTIFHVAFHQWIADGETRSLDVLAHEGLAALRDLTRA